MASPPRSFLGNAAVPQWSFGEALRDRACAEPTRVLGSFLADGGRVREVVLVPGARETRLVVDRDAHTETDARLVAHLAADEPESNADRVCRLYLDDAPGRYCRPLTADDCLRVPTEMAGSIRGTRSFEQVLRDRAGTGYRLAQVAGPCREIPQLRWVREPAWLRDRSGDPQVVSLRTVIGALESYEPARVMTAGGVAAHRFDRQVSVVVLAAELHRLDASPITLNRLLRHAVLRGVGEGLTLSLIAMRCGRIKRDPRGNVSGETSWLGRRLGLLPEGGSSRPTPWIHSDVLALIARRGLGICPREVELG
jgi:hypothetical protein